jgi:hypothetical protein
VLLVDWFEKRGSLEKQSEYECYESVDGMFEEGILKIGGPPFIPLWRTSRVSS